MPEDPRPGHPYEYTALVPITVDGVLGYNTGDGVPAGNVKTLGLEVGVDVAKVGTRAEAAAVPLDPYSLRGQALDDALDDAGLGKDGTADEKRTRLADHLQAQTAAGMGVAQVTA